MTNYSFTVPDMDCGGCVSALTKALHRLDAQAIVAADLPTHRLNVTSAQPEAALVAAIEAAGFSPSASL